MKRIVLLITLLITLLISKGFSQERSDTTSINKDMVIAQMNYCVNSLTNIINNKSMIVFEHETDQLINNLTMEHIGDLYEVADFRSSLLEIIGNLQITEEERNILKRTNAMKKDALLWQSLSSALDPTLLLTGSVGGSQVAFMALLTIARTAVEYKSAQADQNIGELQAMWELRKEDMKEFIQLRKKALDLEYSLYRKYKLSESDRLTEQTATKLSDICSENNPQKRLRLLLDNQETYNHLSEYQYHIGMAYIDLNQYSIAKPYLLRYIEMYQSTPIFRYDEKSGCVALAMLTCDPDITNEDRKNLIKSVLTNLPSNGTALVQCVLTYLLDLKDPQNAYNLLRMGIDNPNMDNKNLMVMLATNIIHDIKKYPNLHTTITSAVESTNDLNLSSIVAFTSNNQPDDMIAKSRELITFYNVSEHPWYGLWTWGELSFNENIEIGISSKYRFNKKDIQVYHEFIKDNKLNIIQRKLEFKDGITKKYIQNEVDCFKSNTNLMYLFVTPISNDGVYRIKENLDYGRIKTGEFRGLAEFTLTEDDLEDIVQFCQDHELSDSNFYSIITETYDCDTKMNIKNYTQPNILSNLTEENKRQLFISKQDTIFFNGENLAYTPYFQNVYPENTIKIVFNGTSPIVFTYAFNTNNRTEMNLYSVETNEGITYTNIESIVEKLKKQNEIKPLPKKESTITEEISDWWNKIWND